MQAAATLDNPNTTEQVPTRRKSSAGFGVLKALVLAALAFFASAHGAGAASFWLCPFFSYTPTHPSAMTLYDPATDSCTDLLANIRAVAGKALCAPGQATKLLPGTATPLVDRLGECFDVACLGGMHKATATIHKGACVLNCAGGFVNSTDATSFGQCLASVPPVTGADVILDCSALPKPLPPGKKCACADGMTYNAGINLCVGENTTADHNCRSNQLWNGEVCVAVASVPKPGAKDCPAQSHLESKGCVLDPASAVTGRGEPVGSGTPGSGTPGSGTTGSGTGGSSGTGSGQPHACPTGMSWNGSACVSAVVGAHPCTGAGCTDTLKMGPGMDRNRTNIPLPIPGVAIPPVTKDQPGTGQ
jgi:hypothetical protein